MNKIFWIAAVLALAASATGCKDDDNATCASVMENTYSIEGCAYNDDYGNAMTESQAVDWCEGGQAETRDCGCGSEMQAVLDCEETNDVCDTGPCQSEYDTMYACLAGC